ncbi:hypothetical protein FHG87_025904 [Trinorchestia longiramus]|nr:hypothetical protein FHG87_025904 [Trinorchestia longiramus]
MLVFVYVCEDVKIKLNLLFQIPGGPALSLHFSFFISVFITAFTVLSFHLSFYCSRCSLLSLSAQHSLLSSYRCLLNPILDHIPDHIPDHISDHILDPIFDHILDHYI